MDEGRPSNWYAHNLGNCSEENNHNQEIENRDMALSAHCRRHRGIALAIMIASCAILSLELRISMHNNILPGWLKVEEYLWGHPRRMLNRVRMIP